MSLLQGRTLNVPHSCNAWRMVPTNIGTAQRRGIIAAATTTRARGLPRIPTGRLEDIKELKDLGVESSELRELELRDVRVRPPPGTPKLARFAAVGLTD